MARLYMQNDLISRSALKKTFEDAELGEHSLIESVLAAGVYAGIDNAPTIDAVPVVHARWDEPTGFQDGFWVCSACNFCTEATAAPQLYKYCPNCGSVMDSEGDD